MTSSTTVDAGSIVGQAISDVGAPLATILASGIGLGAAVYAVSYGWRKFKGVSK